MKFSTPEKKIFNSYTEPSVVLKEAYPTYRLIIPADEPVSRQLRTLRNQWEKNQPKINEAEVIPGITLAQLAISPEREALLLKWLENICAAQPAFRVTLNNCGVIPPQTLYIKVQDATPFECIVAQLKELHLFIQPPNDYHSQIFQKPFVKLGQFPQNMHPNEWFAYTHQLFHVSFMAKKIHLLHYEKNCWKLKGVFHFKKES
jgi:hypothetical protein